MATVGEPTCTKCGEDYFLEAGLELSDFCHPCAQLIAAGHLHEVAAAKADGIREGMERAALWLEETNLTEGWISRKLAEALRAE